MGVAAKDVQAIAEAHGVSAEALADAVTAEFERRAAKRAEHREQRLARSREDPSPTRGKYAKLRSGAYRPRQRPQSDVSDREFVPAALRHWRQIHGLTTRQAQARIGYSAASCSWRHWEEGVYVPPYRTLLLIIAATGLGYWVDQEQRHADPAVDLEARAASHSAVLHARRDRAGRRERARRAAVAPPVTG